MTTSLEMTLLTRGRVPSFQSVQTRMREVFARSKTSELLEHRPTVLVVQSRSNSERLQGEQKRISALAEGSNVQVLFVNPLAESEHPWEDPRRMLEGVDGVIFTGSSDVDLTVRTPERDLYLYRVTELAREAVRKGSKRHDPLPVLGICLGHQMIHLASGGAVERDLTQAETGTGRVVLTDKGVRDPLLANVPLKRDVDGHFSFLEIFGHKDSVTRLGKRFERLGSTERNQNSLARRRGVFTTQGHPEITDASALRRAMELAKGHDSRMGDYEQNYPIEDTTGTEAIVENFFGIVAQRVEKRKDRVVRR